MLTTTYSLIVFSAEQNGIRTKIASLRDHVEQGVRGVSVMDGDIIEGVLKQLHDFHEWMQRRKIDNYLISKMRKISGHAASLLAELESLGLLSLNILRSIKEKLVQAIGRGGLRLVEFQGAVELYCTTVLKKIDKEENELFPMASRVLTAEDWFQVAKQLLSHDANIAKAQRCAVAAPAPVASRKSSALLDQARLYSITMSKACSADRRVFAHPLINPGRQQYISPHAFEILQEDASGYDSRSRRHA